MTKEAIELNFSRWISLLKNSGIAYTFDNNVLSSKLESFKYGYTSLELKITVVDETPVVKVNGFLDIRYKDKNPSEAVSMFITDRNVHFLV